MKARLNVKGKEIFKNKNAALLYDKFKNDSNVFESGIDSKGNVYFAFLNGNIERYSRRDFIAIANDPEKCPKLI